MMPLDGKDKKQQQQQQQTEIDSDVNKKMKNDKKEKEKERISRLKREYKQDLSKSKRAKYSSASLSANRVYRDFKKLAKKHITNAKSSFDHILLYKFAGSTLFSGFEKFQ